MAKLAIAMIIALKIKDQVDRSTKNPNTYQNGSLIALKLNEVWVKKKPHRDQDAMPMPRSQSKR